MQRYPEGVELENSSCPNGCNSSDKKIFTANDYLNGVAGTFSVVKCMVCNLERTDPRPTSETMGFYYPENYGPYQSEKMKSKHKKSSWSIRSKIRDILGFDDKVIPNVKVGKMLEFGCSTGNYLTHMKNLGWVVEGVEFSPEAAQKAIDEGHKVEVASIEQAENRNAEYDLIVAWMVLEHLHDPVYALKKLRGWLKEDGYFVFSIPDSSSISRKIFGKYSYDVQLPTHLYHFSPNTICALLENCGWKIEKIRWQRNSFTFLKSVVLWSEQKDMKCINRLFRKLVESQTIGYVYFRLFINVFFGLIKQSGRIEITTSLRKEC